MGGPGSGPRPGQGRGSKSKSVRLGGSGARTSRIVSYGQTSGRSKTTAKGKSKRARKVKSFFFHGK